MDAERWQRIEQLCQEALDHKPCERAAYLDTACAEDPGLRSEVESLLEQQPNADRFLEDPAIEVAAREFAHGGGELPDGNGSHPTTGEHGLIGRRITHYRIVEKIATGGMGEVYRAVRADQQYEMQVAIKLVRPGWQTEFILRRFQTEQQVLATLEHPNIARILDAGITEDGIPYFVMEYIEGEAIDQYCDKHRLTVAERLVLFCAVCSAVHYAHQRLVVHRDIKPANILVTANGVPKLLDFGIAKILHPESTPESGAPTVTLVRLMTVEYSSPEQLRGEPITTATDVYSLGVVLNLLLTGRLPYRLNSRSPHEIARAICETEPERPSVAIQRAETTTNSADAPLALTADTISNARRCHPEKLRRLLLGDLDQIVLKAIRKEPQERYASAEQLAEDLRRHQEALPVLARNGTMVYRCKKYVQRHKVVVTAAALVLVSLLTGITLAMREARIAERRSNDIRRLADSLTFEVYDSIKDTPGTTAARKLVIQHAQQYLDDLARQSGSDASTLRDLAAAYGRLADVEGNYQQGNGGNSPRMLEDYREAVALAEKALSLDRSNRDIQRELALHYLDWSAALRDNAGRKTESDHAVRRAVQILEPLAAEALQDAKTQEALAKVYMGLGTFLRRGGDNDFPGALNSFSKALTIFETLSKSDPGNETYKAEISDAHRSMGAVLAMQKNWGPALEQYKIALPMDEARLVSVPGSLSAQRDLSVSYSNTGFILVRQGDLDSGLEYYLKALKMRLAFAAADPDDIAAEERLANTYNYIGGIYERKGDFQQGIEYKKKALVIREAFLQKDPTNDGLRIAVADCQKFIGQMYGELAARGQVPPSQELDYYRECTIWSERAQPEYLKRKSEGRQEGAEIQTAEELMQNIARCKQKIAQLSLSSSP